MPPQQTIPRSPAATTGDGSGAVERRAVTAFMVVLAALLAAAAASGPTGALAALGLAGFVAVLAMVGRERMALGVMLAAFATAPMYKGLAPSPDMPITPTDLLFGLGVFLLVPTLIGRPLRLPLGYVLGALLVMVTGILSTIFSPQPLISSLQFAQWLVVLVGLVGLMALWAPGWRKVDLLLWAYVAGHVVSVLYSPIGDSYGGRYYGLTHHPNAFGEAGVMAIAALLYLWRRHTALWYRVAVLAAGAASAVSVVQSGSRAAAVVVAGLIVMIPVVERSAARGFVLALLAALGMAALPFVLDASGEGSALSRLAGTANAFASDDARSDAQALGIEMFLRHPIVGGGFAEAIYVHNVVLAVLASVGVIGLLGYLMVLFVLARPIFGHHPNRRIAYLAWAFIAITPTVPGLEDRTLWVPMAPVILVAMNMRRERDVGVPEPPAAAAGVLEPDPATPATTATENPR